MQPALQTRSDRASAPDAGALDEAAIRTLLAVRSDFLEALPVAAAILTCDPADGCTVDAANQLFGRMATTQPDPSGRWRFEAIALFRDPAMIGELETFFRTSAAAPHQFGWHDGDQIGGRHFTVRLASLRELSPGRPRCLLTLLDRTAEVETARSLRSEMLHDTLTGLPNRVALDEALELAGERGDDEPPFALLTIDLRRFSRINESLGGIAGDEFLITVARRLLSSLRPGDLLARIGGNEFAVLLAEVAGPDEALAAATRLTATLTSTFRLCDLEIRVDCAIGCVVGDGTTDPDNLVRNAQLAMKRAKESGAVELYQPAEASRARRRFVLETDLRRAIERDELTLAFQPVIDLGSGRVAGFEALARWHHPDQGTISPNDFIPVAEEAGLIVPLGRWALESAARTLAQWDRAEPTTSSLGVAVNVSAGQIAGDDMAALCAETLSRHGVCGRRLTLELTETIIIKDPARATQVLDALKAEGVRLAVDDFGTGYSCLAYLQRLPIDVLKIDRSFVTGMLGNRDSVAIVRAVLSLADALGMATTAEGVETFELSQTLAALGCRFAQGFHYAPALSAPDALAYALARNG